MAKIIRLASGVILLLFLQGMFDIVGNLAQVVANIIDSPSGGAAQAAEAQQILNRGIDTILASLGQNQAAQSGTAGSAGQAAPAKSSDGPGFVRYGDLDELGRPTGVEARITKAMIGTGSSASRRIQPPGFITGQGSNRARGHLLGDQLGGSGSDPRNLVTLENHPTNSPIMRGYETRVRQAVEAGETVDYTVAPLYNFSNRIPSDIVIGARGSAGFELYVTIPNPPGAGRGPP